jgi:hypothetical protein
MPPVQKEIVWVGLAKQTAKGAGAANATYGMGVISGKAGTFPIAQDYEATTLNGAASDRYARGVNRTDVVPGAVFTCRAYPRSIGLLTFLALGTNVDAGAGPHTHTATPAMVLPYATVFFRYGSGEYGKIIDCKADSLEIAWSERNPCTVAVDLKGCLPTLGTAAFTTTNDESLIGYLGPVNGVFTLDASSATPAAAQVKSGSCKISNNLVPVALSKSILPDDIMEGDQTTEGVIGVTPNDLTDWRKILTGTGSGTAVSQVPVYGSFSLKVILDANNDLTLSSNRCDFLTDLPDADPGGGPMELDLAYRVEADGTNPAFTALTRNGTPTDVTTY